MCVGVNVQRQLMFLRRPRHVLNASSTRIDPLAIDCATPRNNATPPLPNPCDTPPRCGKITYLVHGATWAPKRQSASGVRVPRVRW